METFTINTTQNVLIRHNTASIGDRVMASILDLVFIFVYMAIISILSNIISSFNNKFGSVIIIVFYIPVLFYHLIFEIFYQGQSLGKKILKIKVAKIDGSEPTLGSYFIRWIFRLIEITFTGGSLALIVVFINGKGQRLGDIVAKTTVISLKEKADLQKTIYVEVPQNYILKYSEVLLLEEVDISTVVDVLRYYGENPGSFQANDLIRQTAMAVENKIGIKTTEPPIEFLRSVIYDFNLSFKENKDAVLF
jgi:uncharacterized RDD family membrane protein YckC